MYSSQMELVLHSLRTTTQNPLPKFHWGICITIFHLGPSAFFPTARTLFITQQGWESNSWLNNTSSLSYTRAYFHDWSIILSIWNNWSKQGIGTLLKFYLQVGAQSAQMKMTPVVYDNGFSWQSFNEEPAASYEDNSFTVVGLLEQLNTTWDASDYLWYMTEWVSNLHYA